MIKIIPATKTLDFECISELARIIWNEHYPSIISLEQIEYMLDKFNSVASMEERTQLGSLFFYMTYNDIPVGYLAVKKENGFLFLEKLYVLKSYRGKKIAKTAIFIETLSCSFKISCMKLHVNKFNTNAILAYKKMGFTETDSIITTIGNGFVMDDYEMIKYIG